MGQFEEYSPRIHGVICKSKIVVMERINVQVHLS